MPLQFIHDNSGHRTGVFIPIEEWEELKSFSIHLRIAEEEANAEQFAMTEDQSIDERLKQYYRIHH